MNKKMFTSILNYPDDRSIESVHAYVDKHFKNYDVFLITHVETKDLDKTYFNHVDYPHGGIKVSYMNRY